MVPIVFSFFFLFLSFFSFIQSTTIPSSLPSFSFTGDYPKETPPLLRWQDFNLEPLSTCWGIYINLCYLTCEIWPFEIYIQLFLLCHFCYSLIIKWKNTHHTWILEPSSNGRDKILSSSKRYNNVTSILVLDVGELPNYTDFLNEGHA